MVESTLTGKVERPIGNALAREGIVVGRHYTLQARIAVGGMASVYLGWLAGAADFSRIVAIKRMHPQFALDEEFAERFRDEARLSARLCHPNIVQVFDVVERGRELLIVMEYVHGVSLGNLVHDAKDAGRNIPIDVIAGVLVPALNGLHAAHEATDDDGRPIGIVHRDFSPQNIMVSVEGHAKILDFGVAKAKTHQHVTSAGQFSGKFGYCSPEQIGVGLLDRRTDVFAAGILLWEALTGEHLFFAPGLSNAQAMTRVLEQPVARPSSLNPAVPQGLDAVVLRALERDPGRRFASARELAVELEAVIDTAAPSTIGECVESLSARRMAKLTRLLGTTRKQMARTQVGLPLRPDPTESSVREEVLPKASPSAVTVAEQIRPVVVRSQRKGLALGAVVLAIALGVVLGSRFFSSSPAPSTIAARPATSPMQPPRREPSAPVTQPSSEVPAIAAEPPVPKPALEPAAGPVPRSGTVRTAKRAAKTTAIAGKVRARPGKTAARTTGNPACDPPWYVDAEGIRIFKDECL